MAVVSWNVVGAGLFGSMIKWSFYRLLPGGLRPKRPCAVLASAATPSQHVVGQSVRTGLGPPAEVMRANGLAATSRHHPPPGTESALPERVAPSPQKVCSFEGSSGQEGGARGNGVLPMDTIGYHQQLAMLAHERGDYWSAARHYEDAAECYPTPDEGAGCRQLAKEELARYQAEAGNRVPS